MKPPTGPNPLENLLQIAQDLRSETGCPWDKAQTHLTVIRNLIEETYEVIDAMESGSDEHFREELGDLLFQIVFHAQLATERKAFSFWDVAQSISEKLIRRHPHVYGNGDKLSGSESVLKQWDEIKAGEKQKNSFGQSDSFSSILDGIPLAFPALLRSQKLQSKARKVGFDWPEIEGIFAKLLEEIEELKTAQTEKDREEEWGDILFVLVNLGLHLKIDPETALRKANDKFTRRFQFMEKKLFESQKSLKEVALEEWNNLWNQAKSSENV